MIKLNLLTFCLTIYKVETPRHLAPSVDLGPVFPHLAPHLGGPQLGVGAEYSDLAQGPLLHSGLHNPEHKLEHAAGVQDVGGLQGLGVVFCEAGY